MTSFLPILTFHALDDKPSSIAFSPSLFRTGMERLYNAGFRTICLSQIVDILRQGKPFPEKCFALTFDDGYQSVHQWAFPILVQFGYSATIFLTVGGDLITSDSKRLPTMSDRTMLSWSEIKEMFRHGITFGAHTLTHPDLTRLPEDAIEDEIYRSKIVLQDRLGTSIDSFAYPFGRYDARSLAIVRRNFLCACSDQLGLLHSSSDRCALKRVDAYYLRSERLFGIMLTRLFPLYVRARAIPRAARRALTRGKSRVVFSTNGHQYDPLRR